MKVNRATGVVVAAVLALGVTAAPRAADDVTTKQVVDAATKYVKNYETALALVLGEETTTQVLDVAPASNNVATRTRRTTGEIFLTFLPADGVWISVHDVQDVDGVPVVDRDSLIDLMQRAPVSSVARDVADRNARFNLGHVTRNFNEPTLPLLLLDEKRVAGVHFSKPSISHDGGATLATLNFEERDRPTLVQSRTDGAIFSKGRFVIDAATGRVERTHIEFNAGGIAAELDTIYSDNPKLKLWLPAEFTERYTSKAAREEINCRSTYANYKRFETVVEMKIK